MSVKKLIQLIVPENPQNLVTSSFLSCLLAWSNELPGAEFHFPILPDSIFIHTLIICHLDSSINHLSPLSVSVCLLSPIHPSHCQLVSFKNTNLFVFCCWNLLWSLHFFYSLAPCQAVYNPALMHISSLNSAGLVGFPTSGLVWAYSSAYNVFMFWVYHTLIWLWVPTTTDLLER